jgi:hypothetical protein
MSNNSLLVVSDSVPPEDDQYRLKYVVEWILNKY